MANSLLSKIPDEAAPSTDENAPNARIKRPADVIKDYQTLFDDDWVAAKDRASVQAMVDGATPFSESRLRLLGLHGITNVNWGDLTQAQQEAEQPFNDILDSMDNFGPIPVEQGLLSDAERVIQEPIIAEEMHRMITGWEDFYFNWWLLSHFFTMFGVGFTYRDDTLDWRWEVGSLQNFKIPRGTKASIDKVDRITMKTDMQPSDLAAKVRNPEAGRKMGWNPEAITRSCRKAMPNNMNTADPEEIEAWWKDNAVFAGNNAVVVTVVHMWVKEVNGTISHYIVDYNGGTDDKAEQEFLYCARGKYGSMGEFVNAYLYGVGTNGDLHSIRGNAYNLFSSTAALNKAKCKFLDKAMDEANTFLSTESEDATIDNMITPRGPYFQLSTGVNFIERNTPPVAGNLVPALQMVQDNFRMRSGGMAPRAAASGEKGQKTKYELQRRDEMDGKLSSSSMNLFFVAFGREYKEIVKRASNPMLQESHPGGKEVFAMRQRCIERGVDPRVLTRLDYKRISVNMGIGKGSSSERRAVLETLNQEVFPRLDPEGQRILTRDTVAAYTDADYAIRLVPRAEGQRPPVDQQIANMENQFMQLGGQATLEPNQDHIVHVATHLTYIQGVNAALESQEMGLEEAIPQMQMAAEHTGQHMEYIDPNSAPYPQFKEALQQFNEVIVNGAKSLEAQQRRAQKQQEQGQEVSGVETPPGVYGAAVDARAKADALLMTSQTKMGIMKKEADQKMAINDALAAQKIMQTAAMARAKASAAASKPKTKAK